MSGTRKQELRRHYRQQRQQALDQGGPALVQAIRATAGALAARLPAGQHLGIYWPLAGEIDLRPLAVQTAVALPTIGDGRLLYRPWMPGQELEPDGCGIPAPPAAAGELAASQMALLLVPALAIDPAGIRLGYGGGWYDRLRAKPAWRQVPALAVLPAQCAGVELPHDPWDVPLAGWISEQGQRCCANGSQA